MKVVFVSNYINHHQIPFCEAMISLVGSEGEFAFIQTEKVEEERTAMGWSDDMPSFVHCSYEDEASHDKCLEMIMDADVALIGWTTDLSLVMPRLKAGALTFRISERLYKKSTLLAYNPRGLIAKYKEHTAFRKAPVYLLCAGAYVASDYGIFHAYTDKMFKWGYFPELKKYGNDTPLDLKSRPGENIRILWAGRFIDWKHAENALKVAAGLSESGIPYHMDLIGTGEMEDELRQIATGKRLMDNVTFTGPMPPEKVRGYMERADIFLSTSDRQEGWGAVINEAMNSGCCVIAPCEAGAVPYLIENGNNGYAYMSDDDEELVSCCIQAARYPEIRKSCGEKALETVSYEWNAEEAAKRLLELTQIIMDKWDITDGRKGIPGKMYSGLIESPWETGPCSSETVRDESVVMEKALQFK
ncbi:MAG: glycosyltransferase [Lachnospiraceae bacterium]|nr:glycosyltransferase [Lachnospiraceae bacterium]